MVVLATLSLCGAEDQGKRQTRNPALLHLAHAGQSVGNYVVGGPRQAVGGHGGGGGGGPHIVIVGGQPAHVTTHVAGRESLEELDEDLQQHYGRQGVRYVPNSSYQGRFQEQVRQHLAYPQPGGTSAHEYGGSGASDGHNTGSIAYGHGGSANEGLKYRIAPFVFNQPAEHQQPGHGYNQVSTFVGRPLTAHQGGASQYHLADDVTPATVNYASPTPYSVTPSPLTHTLATPVVAHTVVPARVPLHPVQGHAFHGVRYHSPLSPGPVFLPVQAVAHQPQYPGHRFGLGQHPSSAQYAPSYSPENEARSPSPFGEEHRGSGEEGPRYYENVQERRPTDHYQSQSHQRDYDSAERQQAGGENAEYDKSFKFGSGESLAKTAGFQGGYPSEEKGSLEESSIEASSGERGSPTNNGVFKYSFADDHRPSGRAYHGDGKVATSYQSVTLETHDSAPRYFGHKQP